MNAFAHSYRTHVIPRLKRFMPVYGRGVALGIEGYTEAYNTLVSFAIAFGALHLPDDIFYELTDWIAANLLEEIMAAEPDRAGQ